MNANGRESCLDDRFGWPCVPVGDMASSADRRETVVPEKEYRQLGVRLWGKGAYARESIDGADTKYKMLNRVATGDIVVNKIWARNGSVSVVQSDLDGCYVSGEFPLYSPEPGALLPDWFLLATKCRWFWHQCDELSRGTSGKNRIKPSQFLRVGIPLPPLPEQKRNVAKVQSLASKIDEVRSLRSSVSDSLNALTISLHSQFSEPEERCFSEFVQLSEERVKVEPSGSYPQIGIRGFGAGIFRKEAVSGCDTSYKHFNRLFPGALIVSQVKGWEGAVAVADDGLDAWFASPEYRTFSCIPGRCDPTYLKHLVRTRWFHAKLADATQGVGARRERVRPERLLATQVIMPSFARQQVLASVLEQAERIADGHAASEKQLEALMPAILDNAFKGQL